MSALPRIVILMSCYNSAGTLPAALDSLHRQTHADWVLLAADDGSGDATPALLEQAAAGDSRVRLFLHTDNRGIAARLNALIETALAEYPESLIARMDADDLCDPARFERQASYMAAHPEVGILASWGRCIAADGAHVKETVETATDHDRIAVNGFFSAPLLHPSVMMRPSVLKALGQPVYDPSLRRAQDYDLWARLVQETRFAVLPEYLLTYRLGSDKKFDKESALNVYRRVIVKRNLVRLGLAEKDEGWLDAAYALIGFPLPKARVSRAGLEEAMRDMIAANAARGLYNPALFAEKLEAKCRKAARKTRWWRRLFS
jgi:glycosyltransferase involved in cell wall biosynthesis